MNAFEDAGYFCVDNLPPEMIRGLVDLFAHPGSKVARAAVVCDVRGGTYFESLADAVDSLQAADLPHRILFLDAAEDTLLDRYKETRRRHPLAPESSIAHGIEAERELLEPDQAAGRGGHGHHRHQGRRSAPPDRRRAAAAGGGAAAGGDHHLVRLQARPAARCRPDAGRSLPAQPALRVRAAAADRSRRAGGGVRGPRRPAGHGSTSGWSRCWTSCCPPTPPRARPT